MLRLYQGAKQIFMQLRSVVGGTDANQMTQIYRMGHNGIKTMKKQAAERSYWASGGTHITLCSLYALRTHSS